MNGASHMRDIQRCLLKKRRNAHGLRVHFTIINFHLEAETSKIYLAQLCLGCQNVKHSTCTHQSQRSGWRTKPWRWSWEGAPWDWLSVENFLFHQNYWRNTHFMVRVNCTWPLCQRKVSTDEDSWFWKIWIPRDSTDHKRAQRSYPAEVP